MKAHVSTLLFLCFLLTFSFPRYGYPQAEDIAKYPSRPINFIITPPPGASSDLANRLIIQEAQKFLGQPKPFRTKAIGDFYP